MSKDATTTNDTKSDFGARTNQLRQEPGARSRARTKLVKVEFFFFGIRMRLKSRELSRSLSYPPPIVRREGGNSRRRRIYIDS